MNIKFTENSSHVPNLFLHYYNFLLAIMNIFCAFDDGS